MREGEFGVGEEGVFGVGRCYVGGRGRGSSVWGRGCLVGG